MRRPPRRSRPEAREAEARAAEARAAGEGGGGGEAEARAASPAPRERGAQARATERSPRPRPPSQLRARDQAGGAPDPTAAAAPLGSDSGSASMGALEKSQWLSAELLLLDEAATMDVAVIDQDEYQINSVCVRATRSELQQRHGAHRRRRHPRRVHQHPRARAGAER